MAITVHHSSKNPTVLYTLEWRYIIKPELADAFYLFETDSFHEAVAKLIKLMQTSGLCFIKFAQYQRNKQDQWEEFLSYMCQNM